MNSLTYKLAGVFLAISLIPLIIGINGTLALQTAEKALNNNNRALQNLSQQLASADQSLTENIDLQERADTVISHIDAGQREASNALQEMARTMLPRSFAVARIRYALGVIAQAERALLLAVNMRHLAGDDLQNAREMQYNAILAATGDLNEARTAYVASLRPGENRGPWEAFENSFTQWQANHEVFMEKIDILNGMVEDLIRGGPLFAKASREAYDTLFTEGKAIREECERRLLDLNRVIMNTAGESVRTAVQTQEKTQSQVENLTRDYGESSERSNQLRARFDKAMMAASIAARDSEDAVASTSRRFWFMALFSAIGVAVAIAIGLLISWRITSPIRKMVDHMSRLAQGDLSIDVPDADQSRRDEIGQLARGLQNVIRSNRVEIHMADAMAQGDYTVTMPLRSESDQLGRALDAMMRNTNDTLARVSKAIDQMGDGASAVSEASRSLSAGAQTSAAAVEEISQTVHNVDQQAQENASHATEANKLATASRDAAQRGYAAVTELVTAMGEIQQSGGKIATVAKLIDDIAFQTNLLALNAAVEAARAGRQGKGFSVVADEVRNLSGRSAKAARETSEMVQAMTQRMEAGAKLAERSDLEFREIVEATEKVASIFQDISGASNAQSLAMAQISQGLSQIDRVIQDNTVSATRTAGSAQTLSRQAEELRRMVGRFKLLSVSFDRFGKTIEHNTSEQLRALKGPAAGRRLLSAPEEQE